MKTNTKSRKSLKGKRNHVVGAPPKPTKFPKTPFTMAILFKVNSKGKYKQCQLSLRNKVDDKLADGSLIALKARKQAKGGVGRPKAVFIVKEKFNASKHVKADAVSKTPKVKTVKRTRPVVTVASPTPAVSPVAPVTHPQVVAPPTATLTPATAPAPAAPLTTLKEIATEPEVTAPAAPAPAPVETAVSVAPAAPAIAPAPSIG